MAQDYGPEAFGVHMADVYDAWYGTRMADTTTAASVAVLADLARRGPVLELAIGTGRVALPLAATGLSVHGVEASEAMLAKLRAKPGGSAIPVTVADIADFQIETEFALAFLVFNTLFNLTTRYQYISITPTGVRLYPVPQRYAWPSEIDLSCQ
jgi:SAM-dependent methyltransferase